MAKGNIVYVVTEGGLASAARAVVRGRYKTLDRARAGCARFRAEAVKEGRDPSRLCVEGADAFLAAGGTIP